MLIKWLLLIFSSTLIPANTYIFARNSLHVTNRPLTLPNHRKLLIEYLTSNGILELPLPKSIGLPRSRWEERICIHLWLFARTEASDAMTDCIPTKTWLALPENMVTLTRSYLFALDSKTIRIFSNLFNPATKGWSGDQVVKHDALAIISYIWCAKVVSSYACLSTLRISPKRANSLMYMRMVMHLQVILTHTW